MANRYWVGGGGDWNSTTKWSASSGGASGASVPTSADNVFIDGNSGTPGTINATGGGGSTTLSCADFTLSVTGWTINYGSTYTLNVYGNFSINSGTTWSSSGALNFRPTTVGKTVATNGVTIASAVDVLPAVTSSGIILSGAFTTSNTFGSSTIQGVIDLNNYVLTVKGIPAMGNNAKTIAFGTGNITVTNPGAAGSGLVISAINTTITGTPVVNVTYTGSNNYTAEMGAFAEASAISYNFSGAATCVLNLKDSTKNITFQGFAGSINSTSSITVYGNFTLGTTITSVTFNGNTITFAATSGTQQITSSGKSFTSGNINFNGSGGTFQLQDNITLNSTTNSQITLQNGTLDLNGKTATSNDGNTGFVTGNGTKNLTFNGGTLVIAATSASAFRNLNPTGFTTTAGTGTGKISMTGATAKTFVGAGSTFNCTLSNDGAGALTVTGSNTFTTIDNGVQPTTFSFTAGTTQTVTNFNVAGTAGNLVTINSPTLASHTLSKATGIVFGNYLSISNSTATGGAAWYAGANSTNGGNNTGWIFRNGQEASSFFFFLTS
jgi:hypothetical protein